ncbi:MAG: hypothetical protein QOD00_2121 [Blastocatellia bacterium]|jgi:hypothetical protein|nr:hypothetical protein [Blastocatellia bacterium]
MPKNPQIPKVLEDAARILRMWAENPTFGLGDLTQAKFQTMVDDLRNKRNQTETLRTQLTALVNETNDLGVGLSDAVTRALSGVRAVFGPDSSQYEQAGGTRRSERKRPTVRKPKKD